MRLRDLLDSDVIRIELESTDKEEAVEELVDVLVRAGRVNDRQGVLEALMNREAEQTTGIGNGVAVPHAKHASIGQLTGALGTSARGVEFDAVDDKPANLIFMILARVNDPGPHVQALAEIARLLQIPGFFRKLVEARSNEELLAVIAAEE